jgi:hypothetical protein
MKPGISVQHSALPQRRFGLVRCDVAGVIGFIPRERWPQDALAGDFVELPLRRTQELVDHPLRRLFDPASRRAVRAFFDNGGDTLHLFGVCIESEQDLRSAALCQAALGPLFERLVAEEEIALLAVPAAAYMRFEVDRLGRVSAHADTLTRELLAHCSRMNNRFLLIDAPRGLHAEGLESWARQLRESADDTLSFGAAYYPWLKDGDDAIPPSGALLGVFARVEREHAPYGVVWPPANVVVRGITHPEVEMVWDEAGRLAEQSINPVVTQPGRGVVVFGARTLSRDPRWQFINSRRIVCMIAEQIRRDNEWVVFEPNDRTIWKVLERDVGHRLDEFWEQGMLTGPSAGKDYEVRCDDETNPRSDREAGILNVQVRLRPIGTTEHITIDLRLGEGTA